MLMSDVTLSYVTTFQNGMRRKERGALTILLIYSMEGGEGKGEGKERGGKGGRDLADLRLSHLPRDGVCMLCALSH